LLRVPSIFSVVRQSTPPKIALPRLASESLFAYAYGMNRYITTTLPYVNADPHIGFALEILQADALARVWRLQGDTVFFNTGTDEHGQKILQAAQKSGRDIQDYVDHYAAEFRKLTEALSLDTPTFIRTTDAAHVSAAEEMWRRCAAAGDIYKKTYTGLYCVGCELYKNEKDLTPDGFCLIHTNLKAEEISEENYFFRFSKYGQQLRDYLSRTDAIVPEWRREEALAFVDGGLEDFSISRSAERLSWGIPVPNDPAQVMYVWFDALTSYLSTLGWPSDSKGNFKTFWEEGNVLQMAGKDQIRFQSLMWQAMLMSAEIKNSDQVFYHGFINSGGQKMSKSLGNVINPFELVDKYGTEATRFLLLRNVHPYDDTDITWERLDEWYTADLVNGIGNLTARVMQMAEANLSGPASVPQFDFATSYMRMLDDSKIDPFRIDQIVDQIAVIAVQQLDERITRDQPFKVVKEDVGKGHALIHGLVVDLYHIAELLQPFMPATSERIVAAIRANKKPENLFPRLEGKV
jgi:methionyl-tRNA synthetase